LPAEEGVEDVAEATEAEAVEAARVGVLALCGGVTEAVVHGAAVGVGEDLVGLVDLLEPRLGAGLAVAVRVVLHGETAEGLLEVVGAGAAGDAEGIVVVLLLLSSHRISIVQTRESGYGCSIVASPDGRFGFDGF
jgi:hypothetical protein